MPPYGCCLGKVEEKERLKKKAEERKKVRRKYTIEDPIDPLIFLDLSSQIEYHISSSLHKNHVANYILSTQSNENLSGVFIDVLNNFDTRQINFFNLSAPHKLKELSNIPSSKIVKDIFHDFMDLIYYAQKEVSFNNIVSNTNFSGKNNLVLSLENPFLFFAGALQEINHFKYYDAHTKNVLEKISFHLDKEKPKNLLNQLKAWNSIQEVMVKLPSGLRAALKESDYSLMDGHLHQEEQKAEGKGQSQGGRGYPSDATTR